MALIHFEHFDLYGTDAQGLAARAGHNLPTASGVVLATGARTGTHCLQLSNSTAYSGLIYALPSSVSVLGQGCAIKITTAPGTDNQGNRGLLFGGQTAQGQIRVLVNDNLGLSFYFNPSTSSTFQSVLLGSTPPGLFSANTWAWVEAKLTVGDPGTIEVRVNNGTIYSAEVTAARCSAVTGAGLGRGGGSFTDSNSVFYDDWVVWDTTGSVNNNWMGDTFVLVAAPTSDGATSDWTPSSGADRFSRVNSTAIDDNTFISSDTAGQAQEFAHATLNLPVGAVAAIAAQTRAFKSDAGSANYKLGLASGASTGMSAEIALATGVIGHTEIRNLDPATGLPWVQAAAQAARLRLERV